MSATIFKNTPYVLIPIFGLMSFLAFSVLNYYTKKGNDLAAVEEGVNICFNRINQSYMANILKDTSSPLLAPSFTETTGDCISEVVSFSESIFTESDQKVFGLLNLLSNDTFWFHQGLLGKEQNFSQDTVNGTPPTDNLGGQFHKIQMKINEILGIIDEKQAFYQGRHSLWVWPTYASVFFLVWVSIHSLLIARRKTHKEESKVKQKVEAPIKQEPLVPKGTSLLSEGLVGCFNKLSSVIFTTQTLIDIQSEEDFTVSLEEQKLEECLSSAMGAAIGFGCRNIILQAKKTRHNDQIEIIDEQTAFAKKALETEGFVQLKDKVKKLGTIKLHPKNYCQRKKALSSGWPFQTCKKEGSQGGKDDKKKTYGKNSLGLSGPLRDPKQTKTLRNNQ